MRRSVGFGQVSWHLRHGTGAGAVAALMIANVMLSLTAMSVSTYMRTSPGGEVVAKQ